MKIGIKSSGIVVVFFLKVKEQVTIHMISMRRAAKNEHI
jgi:uncharacterized DUF497 family protein